MSSVLSYGTINNFRKSHTSRVIIPKNRNISSNPDEPLCIWLAIWQSSCIHSVITCTCNKMIGTFRWGSKAYF